MNLSIIEASWFDGQWYVKLETYQARINQLECQLRAAIQPADQVKQDDSKFSIDINVRPLRHDSDFAPQIALAIMEYAFCVMAELQHAKPFDGTEPEFTANAGSMSAKSGVVTWKARN